MKKIGLFVKPQPHAQKKAKELEAYLLSRHVEIVRQDSSPPAPDLRAAKENFAPVDLFAIIVLGGDGTFLAASRWVGEADIPLLGIKFGNVGFLCEAVEENMFEAVKSVLDGTFEVENRPRLLVTVHNGKTPATSQVVLNDVVFHKRSLARLAYINTWVDGHYVTKYAADGLIVATPTGSTAYNLAAGGPIIHPQVSGTIITPICPFTLTNRPLIVPDRSVIKLGMEKGFGKATITLDGQAGLEITDEHTVTVTSAPKPLKLIKALGQNYFALLKTKLSWSGYNQ